MNDEDKTNEQLINELVKLRQRITELEALEAEHKRLEEALIEIETRIEHELAISPAITYCCKVEPESKLEAGFSPTYVSANIMRLWGYEVNECLGDPRWWPEHLHPEDRPRVFDGLPRLFEKGHLDHEYRFRHKAGSYRWVRDELIVLRDAAGRPVELEGAWLDITELKQAEMALHQANEELERRVKDRTAELVKVNEALQAEISERKRTEETLLESEEYFRVVLKNSPIVVFSQDRELRYTWIYNPHPGFSVEAVLGKTDAELLPPEDAIPLTEIKRGVLESGIGVREEVRTTINGEALYYDLTVEPWRDSTGSIVGITCAATNITERKQAEKALQDSEQRLAIAIEATGAGIYDHKVPLGPETYHSERWASILGYQRAELPPPDHFLEWLNEQIHPEDRSRLWEAYANFTEGRTSSYEVEIRIKHRTGDWKFVKARSKAVTRAEDGRVTHIVGVMLDITARKRVEESLRQYSERLEILHQIDQDILAARSSGEIAQAAVRYLRRLLPNLWVGVVMFDFKVPEVSILAADTGGQLTVRTGTRFPLEAFGEIDEGLEVLRQGNVYAVNDVSALAPLPPAIQAWQAEGLRAFVNVPLITQDELIGMVNLGRDTPGAFTEEQIEIAREVARPLAIAIQQAHLYEQMQRQTEYLEQRVAERTAQLETTAAELETFAYSVSHDLRAPLRAMQGFAEVLLRRYEARLEATGQEYARRIASAAERMDALLQDLLVYSQLNLVDLPRRPVSLELVIEEAMAELAAEIVQKEAQVVVERPLPEVAGHHATLLQVVTNLLSNGLKFVVPEAQPQVRVWAEARGEWERLWVADKGLGIAPESQGRIFKVFERLHGIETYPGTGIGLAIVRKAVERLGGRVGVESEVGRGSRFWVELRRP